VQPKPGAIGEPRRCGQVTPLEAVAELADDRRALAAEDQAQEDRDDGVGASGAEQDVGAIAANTAEQVGNHPQGFERGGKPARPREIESDVGGSMGPLRAAVASHGKPDIVTQVRPGARQPQCHALDPARLETV